MDLTEKIREMLQKDYGIKTDAELMWAIGQQKRIDIGIFAFDFGLNEKGEIAVKSTS